MVYSNREIKHETLMLKRIVNRNRGKKRINELIHKTKQETLILKILTCRSKQHAGQRDNDSQSSRQSSHNLFLQGPY